MILIATIIQNLIFHILNDFRNYIEKLTKLAAIYYILTSNSTVVKHFKRSHRHFKFQKQ